MKSPLSKRHRGEEVVVGGGGGPSAAAAGPAGGLVDEQEILSKEEVEVVEILNQEMGPAPPPADGTPGNPITFSP